MDADPVTSPSDQRARRKDSTRNRAALLAAGAELFETAGPLPTLDDIARRAGVGVGTAYRHFPNKYVLARAVHAEAMAAMLDAAEDAVQSDDAATAVALFFEAVLEPQSSKRALGRLLREAPDAASDAEAVQGRIERCIEVLLRRGREQRVIRPDLTSTDMGVLMSAMAHVIETFGDADPQLWRRVLPIVLDGIRADAPTSLGGSPLSTAAFLRQLNGS